MKTLKIITTALFLCLFAQGNAQFLEKLAKKAEKAAERTIERRVERESQKKTDKGLDEVLGSKKNKKKKRKTKSKGNSGDDTPQSNSDVDAKENTPIINRASDFTPGLVTVFEDNFIKDHQGDFPAKWDTNGSGEIVLVDGAKWLRLGGSSTYIPMLKESLPDNFTVEFDMMVTGLDRKTSSQSWIVFSLENTALFDKPRTYATVELSPCPWIESPGVIEKRVNGERQIRNQIGKDYRELINGTSRISIAVNKTRMRVWMNENKLVDIPRLVPEAANIFKISVRGLRDALDLDEVYISNFRIGKAGVDNRSKLISEGRLSTNAIQFESGSDALLPASYKTIREIANVLEENPKVSIKIIGHTDADGSETSNLELSKKRAQAVKNAMEYQYGIAGDRMTTDGKGESDPIADNSSAQGKSQNRRVEFIKL